MATGDNAVTCGSTETFLELLARATSKNAAGKLSLRYIALANTPGSSMISCGAPSNEEEIEASFRGLFALDSNGDVAIRLSVTT